MSDVFISYANEDRPRVKALVDALQQRGWSVWWDRTILAGKNWERVLEAALRDARCVIVLWSQTSVESDWVRNEAHDGLERDILVPALLDSVRIPLAFKRIQAANLVGWSGKLPSDQFDELASAISEVLSTAAIAPAQAAAPAPPPPMKGRRVVSDKRKRKPAVKQRAQRATQRTRSKQVQAVRKGAVRREGGTIPAVDDRAVTVRELRILKGHSNYVSGVAVTMDGKRAVSASNDKMLKVWELESGRIPTPRTLQGHSDGVSGVAVTMDGKRAVSASWDTTLKVWELESGRALRTLQGHSNNVTGVAVTPDGKRAVSASGDTTLKVWELESGRALRTLEGHSGSVWGVAVTPDGKRAVSASGDKTLKVWELASGRALRTLQGHSNWVTGAALTPDGKRAVSASSDKTLKVWELASGLELRTLQGHSNNVTGVAVTPDGKRAVSASYDKTLKVWELASGRELASFKVGVPLWCCAVCPDAKTILAGDAKGVIHVLSLE